MLPRVGAVPYVFVVFAPGRERGREEVRRRMRMIAGHHAMVVSVALRAGHKFHTWGIDGRIERACQVANLGLTCRHSRCAAPKTLSHRAGRSWRLICRGALMLSGPLLVRRGRQWQPSAGASGFMLRKLDHSWLAEVDFKSWVELGFITRRVNSSTLPLRTSCSRCKGQGEDENLFFQAMAPV